MTTRQMLNRRFNRALLAMVAFGLVVGLWCATNARAAATLNIQRVVAALGVGALLRYRWETRCVHCGKALGWMGATWTPTRDVMTSPPCPHCNLSIDLDGL